VGATSAHGHAKTLGGAHDDVGAPFTGRRDQREGQQVGRCNEGGLPGMRLFHIGVQVVDAAAGGGVLGQDGEVVAFQQGIPFFGRTGQLHLDAQRLGAGLDHFDGLRVRVARHHKHVALGFHRALGQRHGLGGGGGLVQHRRIGDGHAREVAHHGLEVDQRLHAALRDFGLVGRVGGVPGGVFEDVAQDDARRVGAVVALADEALLDLVLARDGLELGQCCRLGGGRWQVHGAAACDGARHDGVDECAARGLANHGQHVGFIRRVDADVAGQEFGGVLQRGQGQSGGQGGGHGGRSGCYEIRSW
jgi:hypothetical protein